MNERVRQREHTRGLLLRESRRLFAERGYAAVGLSEIVRAAGVTKGALYHHFSSKTDVFRAVLTKVQHEVAATVAATADAHRDPWDRFLAGCRAFLTATTHPDVARIMLVDGPAVLGWSAWRELDEATSVRHLDEALTDLVAAGALAPQPIAPLTHLLSGAMNEAALWLARSDDPDGFAATWAALAHVLEGLRRR